MILFPGILESIRSRKDKTFALTFGTNELNPEISGRLMQTLNDFGYVAFKPEPFKTEDKELLERLKTDTIEDGSKSPSQRLRAVLYVTYEKDNQGYSTFIDFYNSRMELLITHYKGKLE
jgi:hypothetical protein